MGTAVLILRRLRRTELYASVSNSGRYLTVDRFRDETSWRRFQAEHREAHLALDAESEGLTVGEREWPALTPTESEIPASEPSGRAGDVDAALLGDVDQQQARAAHVLALTDGDAPRARHEA